MRKQIISKGNRRRRVVRHGLSIPFDRGLSKRAEAVADAIAGARRDEATLLFARLAAEAMIEVQRARSARAQLLDDFAEPHSIDEAVLADVLRVERYERRAWSRRKKALSVL